VRLDALAVEELNPYARRERTCGDAATHAALAAGWGFTIAFGVVALKVRSAVCRVQALSGGCDPLQSLVPPQGTSAD
jgi:hypothetical protein